MRKERNESECLFYGTYGTVVVLPLEFFQVEPEILWTHSMVTTESFLCPGPELLEAIAHMATLFSINETVECPMANESPVPRIEIFRSAAADHGGAVHAILWQRFVGKRIEPHFPIVFDAHTENRRIVANPPPATGPLPAAPTKVARECPVRSLKTARKLDSLCSPVFCDDRLSDASVEEIDRWLPISCDLRCAGGWKIQAEAEEDICELPESSAVPLPFRRELLPAHSTLPTIIS